MPDPTDTSSDVKAKSDDSHTQSPKTPADDKKPSSVSQPQREQEPAATESQSEAFGKIQEISKEAEINAEAEVQNALGEEARLSQKEPKIGPDLEDHGVRSPEADASRVIKDGGVVELPITEEELHEAQKAKIVAHVDEKKNVSGVSSVIALAMWAGRIIKMAHEKTLKIIFKKG